MYAIVILTIVLVIIIIFIISDDITLGTDGTFSYQAVLDAGKFKYTFSNNLIAILFSV